MQHMCGTAPVLASLPWGMASGLGAQSSYSYEIRHELGGTYYQINIIKAQIPRLCSTAEDL